MRFEFFYFFVFVVFFWCNVKRIVSSFLILLMIYVFFVEVVFVKIFVVVYRGVFWLVGFVVRWFYLVFKIGIVGRY